MRLACGCEMLTGEVWHRPLDSKFFDLFFPHLLGPKFFLNIYSILNQNQVNEVSGGLDGISGPLISPFCKLNDCWGKGTIFGALPKLLFQ